MKRIIAAIFFLIASVYNGYSQQSTYQFYGITPPIEGSTVTYRMEYTPYYSIPLSGLNASFDAVNGQVISQQGNMHNNQPVTVTIHWNCQADEGEIDVLIYGEYGSQTIHFYDHIVHPVTIVLSSMNPEFCTQVSPKEQYVMFNALPEPIAVTNCSPSCEAHYGFTYEWEYADITTADPYGINAVWYPVLNIDGSAYTGISYQPSQPILYLMKAYRRITIYTDPHSTAIPAPQVRKYSENAFVRSIPELDPGAIYTSTPVFHQYHNTPIVTALPAFGGLCIPSEYLYTWQSTDAAGVWHDIGTGENFPANTEEISYSKKYRRQIECGGEVKYSNEVTIYFNYISENIENRNYVREVNVRKRGVREWNQVDGELEIGNKLQNTTYLDGFGRPIQKVSKQTGTPSTISGPWLDNVEFFEYDCYGRQPNNYLPYASSHDIGKFKSDAKSEQKSYYESINADYTNYTYSVSTFDNSPLNRVTNTKLPGQAWHLGHGSSADFDYPLNKESEQIPKLTIGFNEGDVPKKVGIYKNNTLIRSKISDDNGNVTLSYTDKNGLLVFKKVELKAGADEYAMDGWVCTYYVYDDYGTLRYTLEPEAVMQMRDRGWDFTTADAQAILDGLCFKYFYDERGNTIVKKTPGNAALTMAYDKRNRLILSQDGNMRNTASTGYARCNLSLYDDQDRPTITAMYNFINPSNDFDYYKGLIEQAAPNDVAAIFQADLATPAIATILKQLYYDDYSFANAKPFDNGFHNTLAYPANQGEPIQSSKRIKGFATGSSTLVLDGNNTYMNTTTYYDDEGRPIQTLTDNFLQGEDIVTSQYHWDGRLLSTDAMHTGGSSYTRFSIVTKNTYDKIGRVKLIEKIVGSNAIKKIVAYDYDNLGRVKTKHLSPDYTGTNGEPDIETLNYSYNLHGRLEGMNKDYALKTPGLYNKWGSSSGKFFGFYLGYDIKPENGNLFTNQLLAGQIAAQVWNTKGDDEQRKFEYAYDMAGRLLRANFFERNNDAAAWDDTKINFSVGGISTAGTGLTSTIGYDLNGNITNMWQKGLLIGDVSGIIKVDDLHYSYEKLPGTNIDGNKLLSVTDAGHLAVVSPNENLGDFKDEQASPDPLKPDYVYDENGNLLLDKNKGLKDATGGVYIADLGITSGIVYNHLDKPETIRIDGKGTIKITYDADGNKLRRLFESDITGETKCTMYVNGYVYTATYANGGTPSFTAPAYINFEEGRIRVINNYYSQNPPATTPDPLNALDFVSVYGNLPIPDATSNTAAVFDYYIKDQLQNVRMIVTEEEHKTKATCTMEQVRQNEELVIGGFNYPSGALMDKNNIPPGTGNPLTSVWSSAGDGQVVKLTKTTGDRVGPSTLQKVMAGDEITARCSYFYNETPANINEHSSLPSLIAQGLVDAVINGTIAPSSVKEQLIGGNNLPTSIGNELKDIVGPHQDEVGTPAPKAYLTILFFDERFKFVNGSSYYDRADQAGDGADDLLLPNVKAPKNGYVFIYVSNESDIPVYFDNMVITHNRGELIEENHYYPFGLKIATISSVKIGDALNNEGELKNNRQYQGEYNEFDEELGWNDFALRTYDPQIGRWLQADPYDEFSSPYVGMGNDPVSGFDPSGGSMWDWFSHLNVDGSRTFKWFDGKGQGDNVGEGWEWAGKEVDAFKTVDGRHVRLHDNGIKEWIFPERSWINQAASVRLPSANIKAELKSFVPTKNWAAGWDEANSSWLKYTGLGVGSNIVYGILDGFKIFGSSVINGSRDATNLRGENLINTYGAKAAESMKMVSAVGTISAMTPLGAIEGAVVSGGERAIVIGEGMGAVKSAAKNLQSKGINAKWYQAWSKNFPKDRLMTKTELDAALTRNERWFNKKLDQGYTVYDKGIDATRVHRSPFYQVEKDILKVRKYPTIPLE